MRGEFNNTLRVRYGPSSPFGAANFVWITDVPCRFVLQREIDQRQFPFTLSGAWVTLDLIQLHGPTSTSPYLGGVLTNYKAADQVEVSDHAGVWWVVMREERVHPFGRPNYWRYLLMPQDSMINPPWPPPVPPPPPPPPPDPPPPPPGVTCELAETITLDELVEGTTSEEGTWYVINIPVDGEYSIRTHTGGSEGSGACEKVFYLECGDPQAFRINGGGLCTSHIMIAGEYRIHVYDTIDPPETPWDMTISFGPCGE